MGISHDFVQESKFFLGLYNLIHIGIAITSKQSMFLKQTVILHPDMMISISWKALGIFFFGTAIPYERIMIHL